MMPARFLPLLFLLVSLAGAQASEALIQEETAARAYERAASELEAAASAYSADKDGDRQRCAPSLSAADQAFTQAQEALGIRENLVLHIPTLHPRGRSRSSAGSWRRAAKDFLEAARLLRAATSEEDAEKAKILRSRSDAAAFEDAFERAEKGVNQDAYITGDFYVLAILLGILALLFAADAHPTGSRVLKVVPLLVFAYFVPTLLSNTHLIPIASPLYTIIKKQLLPASLVLLVLAVDIPAVLGLGRNALVLFFFSTLTIVIGGPLAFLVCKGLIPEGMGEEAWKGLAALSGSWIGGGANFIAIGESVGVSASTLSMMVVVDVAVSQMWMAVLLFFAGREKAMDEKIGADRSSLDRVRERIESFERKVSRPTSLADLLSICAIAFGVTAIANGLASVLPDVGDIIRNFTWVVLICTTVAVGLSFTRLRRLEGAGAGKLGSLLLYLLVASIGAHAEFAKVLQVPALVAIGALWMSFHAVALLMARRYLKAPIFFAAVGSKANVGGAASAPIVASAFHPALAPVGVLLAVVGYVLGTYAGLLCAALLKLVS